VEIYGRVRRAVRVEGRSQRAVARDSGLSRGTFRKMLQYAVPPGYQRQEPIKRPKLGLWGVIDAILEDDKQRPSKQRHTAKRIFERLKEEHGFTGGYTIVKDYVERWLHLQDAGACRSTKGPVAGRAAAVRCSHPLQVHLHDHFLPREVSLIRSSVVSIEPEFNSICALPRRSI
jgi:transposase